LGHHKARRAGQTHGDFLRFVVSRALVSTCRGRVHVGRQQVAGSEPRLQARGNVGNSRVFALRSPKLAQPPAIGGKIDSKERNGRRRLVSRDSRAFAAARSPLPTFSPHGTWATMSTTCTWLNTSPSIPNGGWAGITIPRHGFRLMLLGPRDSGGA